MKSFTTDIDYITTSINPQILWEEMDTSLIGWPEWPAYLNNSLLNDD